MQSIAPVSPAAPDAVTTASAQFPHQETNRPPPETVPVTHHEVYCDGSGYGDGGQHKDCANIPAALGHPRVFLTMPRSQNFVDCTYCDRRFVLIG